MNGQSPSANTATVGPGALVDQRLEAIEAARKDANSWRRSGQFRIIWILLAIAVIVGGGLIYFLQIRAAAKEAAEQRKVAEAWRKDAIASQFRHHLAAADKAQEGGKRDFARAVALASRELTAEQDPSAVATPFYANTLLTTLSRGTRELYVFGGEQTFRPEAAYSGDSKVVA